MQKCGRGFVRRKLQTRDGPQRDATCEPQRRDAAIVGAQLPVTW
jgi:hypothetical protein